MRPESPDKVGHAGQRFFFSALTAASLLAGCVGTKPVLPEESNHRQSASPALMQDYVQALLLEMKGDYWEAIKGLRKVMTALPDEPAVRFSISQSYRHLAVLDSARVYGQAAVKLDPSNPHYLRYLASLEDDAGEHGRAAELYGTAFELEPDKPELLYLQGLELMSASQLEQAIEAFEKAVHADPYNEKALSQMLHLQIRLKQYPAAVETCKKLLGIENSNLNIRMLLGELYAKNGQDSLALATFQEVTQTNPGYVSGWSALFDFYINAGRPEEFHREVRTLFDSGAVSPKKIDNLVRLFIVRSGKQKRYEAPTRELLDELIASRPHDSSLFVLKGLFEMIHEREHDGQRCFARAIKLDSRNAEAWESLITSQNTVNEKRQAWHLLRKARKALPGERLRWKLLEGALLLNSGSPKQAATVLEQAIRLNMKAGDMPLLLRAHINLALAYDELGMKNRSRLAYATVLKLDAHNTLAMNNLAYLLAEEGIELQQALLLATNAVLLDPDNGIYLDTLGWVNFKLGKFDQARLLLEKAVETGIDKAEIYRHLGEVYRKLGNEPKAREMLDKAGARRKQKEKSGH